MVVDFHVHCFPDSLAPRALTALAESGGVKPWLDGTIGGLKASMKESGIGKAVVLPVATKASQTPKINQWAAQAQGDGIIAFGTIHPGYGEWKEELSKIKELGLKGIKMHPDYQGFFVDAAEMFPIYEQAFELGLIILFHAGVDIGLPEPYHCTPAMLKKVIETFPGGKVVAAHFGGYLYWDEVEKYLVGTNIYFDTSFSIGAMGSDRARRMILSHGYEKVLFATDSPWTSQARELERIRGLGLEKEVEEAVLGLNALKLLAFA